MTDASGATDYAYDARGNLIAQTILMDGITQTTSYAYNGADQLTQMTYPSGRTVDYTRNVLGQTDSVTTTLNSNTQTVAGTLTYAPFGPMRGLIYGINRGQTTVWVCGGRTRPTLNTPWMPWVTAPGKT